MKIFVICLVLGFFLSCKQSEQPKTLADHLKEYYDANPCESDQAFVRRKVLEFESQKILRVPNEPDSAYVMRVLSVVSSYQW
jgi:hypothetical protein